MERGRVYLKKELDDEGFSQNKMLCSSLWVKLPPYRLSDALPGRQNSGYLPASGFGTVLTQIFPCCLFLVALFGALLSASCWSSLFLLQRLSRLDGWSNYWWCSVDSRRSCCQLVRIVLVEQADELFKVLDHWGYLPGDFFLWISFT